MTASSPSADRITVVVPVRNGASTLPRTLDGLVSQTLPGARIVISDNQSTDQTLAIAQDYAEKHPTITVVQQPELLSAIRHFRTVYELVDTPYFMWAAHDDFHGPEFIEVLLAALEADPSLIAAFPDLVVFGDDAEVPDQLLPFPCDTRGLSLQARLRLVVEHHISMAVYSLWRTEAFATFTWPTTDIAEDWIMMWHALSGGEIAHVPGPRFHYFLPPTPKSIRERARNDAHRDLRPLAWWRVYWAGARVGVAAWERRGGRASKLGAFLTIALAHRRLLVKQRIWRWMHRER